ncbi:MAG: UDP-N-acetylmuramate dehydrogenase [Acholeplasmatales bacterium]|nr:UDP-N-acetylmuramate dehydrogenase [Acholeplasmatales bacterium]
MNFKQYILENNLGIINDEYSFKDITTIGCGGKIKCLYIPKSIEALAKAFKYIKEKNLSYFIIANGSNILASDSLHNEIVIWVKKLDYTYVFLENSIKISAFYPTIKLAYDLANLEYGDLSFLGGIPGTLGGAIYNNSGAYNDNIGNHILEVEYIDTAGQIKTISNSLCAFGYRRSIFHFIEGIIISATLKIEKIKTKELLEKRRKQRLESQPLDNKSMGSIFKNNPLIPSWKIVDALGLRGFRIGDASVSAKHSNFIINLGKAKASDILAIINLIETRSRLEFGINLIKEITII